MAACARPELVPLRTLAEEAADNEFALADKYEGREISVRGMLVEFGVKRREVVEHDISFIGPYAAFGESRMGYERIPYVLLSPDDGEGGVAAVCYFEDRDELRSLKRGETKRFVGTFSAYRRARNLPTFVLVQCSLESE